MLPDLCHLPHAAVGVLTEQQRPPQKQQVDVLCCHVGRQSPEHRTRHLPSMPSVTTQDTASIHHASARMNSMHLCAEPHRRLLTKGLITLRELTSPAAALMAAGQAYVISIWLQEHFVAAAANAASHASRT